MPDICQVWRTGEGSNQIRMRRRGGSRGEEKEGEEEGEEERQEEEGEERRLLGRSHDLWLRDAARHH